MGFTYLADKICVNHYCKEFAASIFMVNTADFSSNLVNRLCVIILHKTNRWCLVERNFPNKELLKYGIIIRIVFGCETLRGPMHLGLETGPLCPKL